MLVVPPLFGSLKKSATVALLTIWSRLHQNPSQLLDVHICFSGKFEVVPSYRPAGRFSRLEKYCWSVSGTFSRSENTKASQLRHGICTRDRNAASAEFAISARPGHGMGVFTGLPTGVGS